MQPHTQRSIKIDINDPQVGDFLHPRSGVVEEHEESSISKRKRSQPGKALEESLDFFVLQIIGLRRCGTFDGDCLHTLRFSQHLRILKGKIPVEGMQGSEPLISRTHAVSSLDLHHVQEIEHSLCGQVRKDKPCDWT